MSNIYDGITDVVERRSHDWLNQLRKLMGERKKIVVTKVTHGFEHEFQSLTQEFDYKLIPCPKDERSVLIPN